MTPDMPGDGACIDAGEWASVEASEVDRPFLERIQAATGVLLEELVALSRGRDPFLVGTPDELKKARWFASTVTKHAITRGHQRGIWYRLVNSGEPIPCTWARSGRR